MASNPYKNKVVYDGTTLIDLTGDTVTAADLRYGKTAHDASGAPITGTAAVVATQLASGGYDLSFPDWMVSLNA